LQNDYYSSLAEDAVPLLLKYIDENNLNAGEKTYLDEVRRWNFEATPASRATTIYQAWVDSLETVVWGDDFAGAKDSAVRPDEITTIELLLRDSASPYIDDISTTGSETLPQQITKAFRIAAASLAEEESINGLAWWKHKNPSILHLLRESLSPFGRIGMKVGGWGNTINAITVRHGPSWRMIVHLTTPTEAYGVYPGGQSGNPGSFFYDNFVNTWMEGKYYTLWVMKAEEAGDKRIRGKISFTNI
jgi:penicillin amidase